MLKFFNSKIPLLLWQRSLCIVEEEMSWRNGIACLHSEVEETINYSNQEHLPLTVIQRALNNKSIRENHYESSLLQIRQNPTNWNQLEFHSHTFCWSLKSIVLFSQNLNVFSKFINWVQSIHTNINIQRNKTEKEIEKSGQKRRRRKGIKEKVLNIPRKETEGCEGILKDESL